MEIKEKPALKTLRRNLEVSVDKILEEYKHLKHRNLSDEEIKNIVDTVKKNKEIQLITQKFYEYHEYSGLGKHSFIENLDNTFLYDEKKLKHVVFQVNSSTLKETRYNALNELLKFPALDIIDKYKWPKLSKSLREFLSGRHKDIFEAALKIHIKLSHHPQTIIESTKNILTTLAQIFQSRKIYCHAVSIEFKNMLQYQIMTMVNLLLNNYKNILKNFHPDKEPVQSLIQNIFDLSIIHTFYERTDYIHFLYYVFVLDPKAKWFQQIMHNITYRKIAINYLHKKTAFLKYIIKEFFVCISFENDCNFRRNFESEIQLDVIKYAGLHHCSNIISSLLSNNWGYKLFPVEIRTNESILTVEILLTMIINAIESLNSVSYLKPKRDILCQILKTIITANRNLLFDKELVLTLMGPFIIKPQERRKLSDVIINNLHVLETINEICNTQEGFLVIFGFTPDANLKKAHKFSSQYIRSISLQEPFVISTFVNKHFRHQSTEESQCIGKIICDFTKDFVKQQINASETVPVLNVINQKTKPTSNQILATTSIFETCSNIHTLHTHVILLINSKNLIETSFYYYKILINKNENNEMMTALLRFFIVISNTRNGIEILVKQDSELLYILCKHYFFLLDKNVMEDAHFSMFFYNLSNTAPGCLVISECMKQLITPFLEKIWKLDEDEILFLSGTNRVVEEEVFKFMKLIFMIQFSYQCVHLLLPLNDSDDESTLMETELKPTNLRDLIDETMSNSGPGTQICYIGLLTIRMLINNLNILLFLEKRANLQNTLPSLQSQCSINTENTSLSSDPPNIILDECSLLRNDIMEYIQSVGFVNPFKETSSLPLSAQYQRRLNEFQRFLKETRFNLHDHNWLLKAQTIFKQCGFAFRDTLYLDLIQQVRLTLPNSRNNFVWPESEKDLCDLFEEDFDGISVVVSFGKSNKILTQPFQYEETLALLIKQVYLFLNVKREKFKGFDWFLGMIFLICGGNADRCKSVIQSLTFFPVTLYIWPTFGEMIGQSKNFDFSLHFDNTLNLLISDLEIFKPATENAGISWNYIVRAWINQCFFNVLEWNEICNFLSIAILYPLDYVLFFIICCAQHLETKILNAINTRNILMYQKLLKLDGLQMSDCFNTMEQLSKQYKNILSTRYT